MNPIVFLNNKRIVEYVSYSIEEGWVEILDLAKISEVHQQNLKNEKTDLSQGEPEPIPLEEFTKKIYGHVTLRFQPNPAEKA